MGNKFQRFNSNRGTFFLLSVITVIIAGAALKLTASIILPFAVSLLLTIVMRPLVNILEKLHIPRVVSIILVICFLLFCFVFIGTVLYSSGKAIAALYPKYEAGLTEIYINIARFFELPYSEHLSFFENLWSLLGVRELVGSITLSVSNGFISFLRNAIMVILFMVFLLLEAGFFANKLTMAFEGERAAQIKKITSDVMTQVTRYLSIKFFLSLATGLIVGFGLKIVGLEFAVVWGVIQFFLNFIPNIGSIAVGVTATLFGLVQFWPEPAPVIAVGLIMLCANMIIGNIMEPKIMGDNLDLSPFVVLVSLLVWGYLWGFFGLILAVPMMAIIKIVCQHIPELQPIYILLSSRKSVMAARNSESTKAGKNRNQRDNDNSTSGTDVSE